MTVLAPVSLASLPGFPFSFESGSASGSTVTSGSPADAEAGSASRDAEPERPAAPTGDDLSVLLPVHGSDDPERFRAALDSVRAGTVAPAEVVVVADASVDAALRAVVEAAREDPDPDPVPVRLLDLDGRRGLGAALRAGVRACSNDLVARMDADDVAVPDRFERQLAFLAAHPEVDVAGGHVAEVDEDEGADARDPAAEPRRVRTVPTDPAAVRRWARVRCPVNHPTVVFRRDVVLRAGNYRDVALEDYDLWVRVLLAGGVVANQDAVLVRMRTGDDFADRRGGLAYLRAECRLFREFLARGFLGHADVARNLLVRAPVRLAPSRLRRTVYERLLR